MLNESLKTLVAVSLVIGVSLLASCTRTVKGTPPVSEDTGESIEAVNQQATIEALQATIEALQATVEALDDTSHSASKSVAHLLNRFNQRSASAILACLVLPVCTGSFRNESRAGSNQILNISANPIPMAVNTPS